MNVVSTIIRVYIELQTRRKNTINNGPFTVFNLNSEFKIKCITKLGASQIIKICKM